MAAIAAERGATIEALGSFSSADVTYSYGTSAAHVAVDPHTGRIKVIDYVSVEDVGRMINPAIVHGQMIGAIVQGLGATFLDEFLYDSDGQLLNASLADYLLPTALDFPCVRSVSLEIVPSNRNPLGVKAAGEGGIVPVAATIGNAVSAALSSFNVQANTLPLTPARVWAAVQGI
jgi:carbon-monoxide dehydrogenase large subunit